MAYIVIADVVMARKVMACIGYDEDVTVKLFQALDTDRDGP